MTLDYKKACVFGGTGFVGRLIVGELARQGYIVKVATRVPERAYFLKTAGNVGQIVSFPCNYNDAGSIADAVRGCELVVNCIGILFEKGKSTFQKIHVDLPRAIGQACATQKVTRLIHLSALGCDSATSKYGKSKKDGEAALQQVFPAVTILRPAAIFGAEDNFFNMFARLSVVLPVLPLIGGGKTKLQPVYAGDVAAAVVSAAIHEQTKGHLYELGGPDVVSFKELYARIFAQTKRPRTLVSLPWGIAKIQGCMMSLLPNPMLTVDQVESLKTDSIVSVNALTFRDLGMVPSAMEGILPTYLARFQPGGRFGDKKRA